MKVKTHKRVVKRIIAIGGGHGKTLSIDKYILALTGKKHPRAIFLPTAGGDSRCCFDDFCKIYVKKLGCKAKPIYLIKDKWSYAALRREILGSDLVYVGGGNTLQLMKYLRKRKCDRVLAEAYRKGVILCGLSAGSLCWFKNGMSRSIHKRWTLVSCLGFINATNNVHWNRRGRKKAFKKIIKQRGGVGIAVEDCCAVEFADNEFRVLRSRNGFKAYKVYRKRQVIRIEDIPRTKEFRPMRELLTK